MLFWIDAEDYRNVDTDYKTRAKEIYDIYLSVDCDTPINIDGKLLFYILFYFILFLFLFYL